MEIIVQCTSLENARNQALARFAQEGGHGGPYTKIVIAKNMGGNNPLAGARVGVEFTKPWIRLRLDYDPFKGPHYNVESNTGSWAFLFTNVHGGIPFAEMSEEERSAVQEWMGGIGARMSR
ncbi:MAG: hypothetical protein U0414_01525 [Polyangiaceae bacterium]